MLSKNEIIELSKRHGFRLTKRLGQNFLIDKNVRNKIVRSLDLTKEDGVLEIGPGLGAITEALAYACKVVYAVEVDKKIYELASQMLSGYVNVKLISCDILDFNMSKISLDKLTVVGALPFAITTPVIEYLIKWREKIRCAYIVIQKEVADRLVSPAGRKDYGAFTLFVNFYAGVKRLTEIKKNSFFPVPRVDSTLVKLTMLDSPHVSVKDDQMFFRIVRQAFSQRRKTMRSALSHNETLGLDRIKAELILKNTGIDPKRRAETVTLEQFAALSNAASDILS